MNRQSQTSAKGYGSALMGRILAARGKHIVMGDADNSDDFLEIPKFVEKLREGFDIVQGCRLPSGGGVVKPGVMPCCIDGAAIRCFRFSLDGGSDHLYARRLLRPAGF